MPVPLGAFLKLAGAARSGGEAKQRVLAGDVWVNGEVERRRGRGLVDGDAVRIDATTWRVVARDARARP